MIYNAPISTTSAAKRHDCHALASQRYALNREPLADATNKLLCETPKRKGDKQIPNDRENA